MDLCPGGFEDLHTQSGCSCLLFLGENYGFQGVIIAL